MRRLLAGAFTLATLSAPAAYAATIDFDGSPEEAAFTFTDARLVGGNCETQGTKCLALNNNEETSVTASDGGTFTATSFLFQLLGGGTNNTLFVDTSTGGSVALDAETFGFNDGGQTFSLSGLVGFTNITSLTFSTSNGGNVRIGDLELNVAPITLPASGLLLFGPLALMIAARRRRQL